MKVIIEVNGTDGSSVDGPVVDFEITDHGSGYKVDDILQIPGNEPWKPRATIKIKSVHIIHRN